MAQKRGPFEVTTKRAKVNAAKTYISNQTQIRSSAGSGSAVALGEFEQQYLSIPRLIKPSEPVVRQFDCSEYDTCLSLTAALNWESFSCAGCCGELNQQLLWRAHQNCRRDKSLASLCQLPELKSGLQKEVSKA